MPKFSQIAINNNPALTDFLIGVSSGSIDQRSTLAALIAIFAANTPANSINAAMLSGIGYPNYAATRAAAWNAAGVFVKLIYEQEHYDGDNSYDPATGRFTVKTAGKYHFDAMAGHPAGATGPIHLKLYKNGAEWKWGTYNAGAGVAGYSLASVSGQLAVGDYIEVYFLGTNGLAIGVNSQNHFDGHLISKDA